MDKAMKTISKLGGVPEYKPQEVKELMQKLELNEKGFAFIMNVTPLTVRLWATGAAAPCNPAKRLMQVLAGVAGLIDQFVEEES